MTHDDRLLFCHVCETYAYDIIDRGDRRRPYGSYGHISYKFWIALTSDRLQRYVNEPVRCPNAVWCVRCGGAPSTELQVTLHSFDLSRRPREKLGTTRIWEDS
jgi:hypothetical protein